MFGVHCHSFTPYPHTHATPGPRPLVPDYKPNPHLFPTLHLSRSIRIAGNAAAGHLQKHKVKHGVGCGVIITVAVVLGVILGATAAVYHYTQRQATASEQARNAQAESVAVNFGQISVVPPKNEETGASRRLASAVHAAVVNQLSAALSSPVARRKLRSIDTGSFDILSDFRTATTSTSVDDGLGGALITPNMILCMLEQTRAEKFFNKGPYIANIDEKLCQPEEGSSSDGGPQLTEWTVLATGPSATETTGMYEVSAWLKVNGFDISFKTETPKEKITFFPDDDLMRDPVVDEFTIKFQTPKDSANQATGFIMVAKEGEDKTMKYIMQQTVSQMTMLQTVIVSYNKDTEAGWAKTSMPNPDYRNPGMLDASVSWSTDFLKQSSRICLDRKNFVGVGQGYKLFDSKGAAVDIESRMTVETTLGEDDSNTLASTGKVIKAGTQFVGGTNGGHIYLHSVVRTVRYFRLRFFLLLLLLVLLLLVLLLLLLLLLFLFLLVVVVVVMLLLSLLLQHGRTQPRQQTRITDLCASPAPHPLFKNKILV